MPASRSTRSALHHLVLSGRAAVLASLIAAMGCGGGDATSTRGESDQQLVDHLEVDAQAGQPAAPREEAAPAPGAAAPGLGKGLQQGGSAADSAAPAPGGAPQVPAMLIRTGQALVEVDSMERAVEQGQALARRVGGYVANTTIQAGDRQARRAELELKIPAARFDDAVSGLRPLGEVRSVSVNSQDVGEEFVDVSARVTNARRLEERLITLLATRTGRLEDVLAVERELARVREEIERYEGRLRYLRTRVAMSTLTVTVAEPAPVVGDYPGSNPIADAFRDAWRNFVRFTAGFIASLGVLIPLGALGLVFALVFRWLRRRFGRDDGASPRRFSRTGAAEPAPPPPADVAP